MATSTRPRPRLRVFLATTGMSAGLVLVPPAAGIAGDPTGWITVGLPGGFGSPFVSGQDFGAATGTFIVTVDDPGTPEAPDHNWTLPDDFPDGGAFVVADGFHLDGPFDEGDVTIEPGFVVRVTDGVATRSTTVSAMEWTAVDLVADTVTGFADPAAGTVDVNVGNPEQWRSTQVNVSATPSPGDGSWTADFSGTRDLMPTDSGFISVSDGDGDQTGILWGAPFVAAGIDVDGPDRSIDSVWGAFWFHDDQVEVWVTGSDGTTYFGPVTRDVENWHWHGWGLEDQSPTGLEVGHTVHVRGLQTNTEIAHTVLSLTVDGLEFAAPDDSSGNVLFGSAQTTDHHGFVRIELEQGMRFVDLEPDGAWFTDLYAAPDEEGEWGEEIRLEPGVTGRVELRGLDGNLTFAWFGEGGGGEPPYDPVVQAHASEEFLRGENWRPGSTVSVTLYESEGGPIIQPFAAMQIGIEGDGTFEIDAHEPESGLQPGMVVVVTDGETTKALELVELRLDSFDPDTNVVTGWAPVRPNGGEIRLHLFDQDGQPMDDGGTPISLHPDGSAWSFDLTTLGYDPSGVLEARVEVPDVGDRDDPDEFDGDGTFGQLPFFRASEQYDFVQSDLFDDDAHVVVELFRGGDLDWTSGSIETSPQGDFHVDAQSGIEPGDRVVVTGQTTGIVKALAIETVTVDGIDVDGDTVSGTASAGALVRVGIGNEMCGSGIETFADGDGHWLADFSGEPGCEEGADFDVTFDMGTQASVLDPDMDENVAMADLGPHMTSLDLPLEPVQVGTPIELEATFVDLETPDGHTATIDWGDGGEPTGQAVSPTAFTATHTYGAAGVYTVAVTVTDQHGLSDEAIGDVVVYDPDGGFVTGGGRIVSPAGAFTSDPTATGPANFGFVAKYTKTTPTPTGNANFQLQVADLHFRSTGFGWLVVAGNHAILSGVGTVNGTGQFGFAIIAVDDPGAGDAFRIVIWNGDGGELVYDNLVGDDGAMLIDQGSIVIHTAKN